MHVFVDLWGATTCWHRFNLADLPLSEKCTVFTVIFIGAKQRDNSSIIFCYDFEYAPLAWLNPCSPPPLATWDPLRILASALLERGEETLVVHPCPPFQKPPPLPLGTASGNYATRWLKCVKRTPTHTPTHTHTEGHTCSCVWVRLVWSPSEIFACINEFSVTRRSSLSSASSSSSARFLWARCSYSLASAFPFLCYTWFPQTRTNTEAGALGETKIAP